MWEAWGSAAALTFVLVTIVWIVSLAVRDSSIVDIFWGAGFVAIGWVTALRRPGGLGDLPWTAWLMLVLVTVWGLRLALHIFMRNRGKGEDYRYRAWREAAGESWWWRSYLKVFLLQGVIMWVVALPIVAAVAGDATAWAGGLAVAGAGLWMIGFVFEVAGDWQLARFKADPANSGRVLTTGVWRYTRHPNYFGDAAVWCGHFFVAAATGAWWSIVSPALMTFLLVRVSGVALLESALRHTKPGYREYIETTSAFLPRLPRRR